MSTATASANRLEIDERAPVIGRGEVELAGDAATVWTVISDIEAWPTWSKDISAATLHGRLEPGSTFEWRAGPGLIRSTITGVDPQRAIAWMGTTMGIRAIHVWRIEERAGVTYLVTEESWSGVLPSVLRGPMRKRLQASIDEGLTYLKAEVDRRASTRTEG